MGSSETHQFRNDLRRLTKKYRSLAEDLKEFRKVIDAVPCGTSRHFAVLHDTGDLKIIKARLFCRYLRGSSLRVIYAYREQGECIEFIELYFKGEKGMEDVGRIRAYIADRAGSKEEYEF